MVETGSVDPPADDATIMVVDHDPSLRAAVAASLQEHHYAVVQAASGEEAIVLAEQRTPNLVLLDLSLPGIDGLVALRRLRAFTDVPVVVVTGRDGKADRLAAFDNGADDYVTKPFDVDELLARIRVALRRTPDAHTRQSVVRTGSVEIDLARGRVTRDGDHVHLTPTEWRFLELLVSTDGGLVTYARVAREITASRGGALDPATQRVFVGQLRKKLGDDAADPRLIVTHFGLGYRWIAGGDEAPSGEQADQTRGTSLSS
jgi:two-component system, OmpR family, KDP operon response regulator KdpE